LHNLFLFLFLTIQKILKPMKNNYFISLKKGFLALMSVALLFSCSQIEPFDAQELGDSQKSIAVKIKTTDANLRVGTGFDACGTPLTAKLLAGKSIPVGEVTVFNDEDNFYVTVSIDKGNGFDEGDWFLTKIHIYAGEASADFEAKGKNKIINPAPGKFPINESIPIDFGVADQEFTYVLAITPELILNGEFDVAVHADVVRVEDITEVDGVFSATIKQQEGAWADGTPFNADGKGNWATYMEYTIQECTIDCNAEWNRTITAINNGEYIAVPEDELYVTYTINGTSGKVGEATIRRTGNAGSPTFTVEFAPDDSDNVDFTSMKVCITDLAGNGLVCDNETSFADGVYKITIPNAPRTATATNPGGVVTASSSKVSLFVVSDACD